jgi:eukaryotic-like serine/threonine-protein kinase
MAFTFKKYTSTLSGLLVSLLITAGSVMIIMILYFYVYLPAVTNHNESITVPEIVGKNYNELEEFIGKRDLRYEVSDSSYSNDHPPLTVLKQYPEAGAKVKENRVIYVSINRLTPPTVPVPNLIDGSLINADAILRSNELKRGRIELVRGPYLQFVQGMKYKGHPIEPGTPVPKGSVIDLVVMDGGRSNFDVPNLIGYEFDEATFVILGQNLNYEVVTVVGDTVGITPVVLKQKPLPPQNMRVGDIVELWIGAAGTPVPDEDEND